jgi:hypothetical protein
MTRGPTALDSPAWVWVLPPALFGLFLVFISVTVPRIQVEQIALPGAFLFATLVVSYEWLSIRHRGKVEISAIEAPPAALLSAESEIQLQLSLIYERLMGLQSRVDTLMRAGEKGEASQEILPECLAWFKVVDGRLMGLQWQVDTLMQEGEKGKASQETLKEFLSWLNDTQTLILEELKDVRSALEGPDDESDEDEPSGVKRHLHVGNLGYSADVPIAQAEVEDYAASEMLRGLSEYFDDPD